MDQVPYRNTGANTIYVAGRCIPPGETRWLEPDQVPAAARAPAAPTPEPAPADPLQALLAGNVREVLEAARALPDADLERLMLAEEGGKPRRTLLEGLRALQLERAAAGEAEG